jgi:Glycosyltransferase family 92
MAGGDSASGTPGEAGRPPIWPDPEAGFFEKLDKSSVPWRGRGTFRFQANAYRVVSDEIFSREEVAAIAAAAEVKPQELRLQGRRPRWWAYEGNWYRTRDDFEPHDFEAWVEDHYRRELALLGGDPSNETQLSPSRNGPGPETYLSACSMFFNEAPHLAEWIEFHLLAGVERFFLYDHESTDESRAVLEPYVEDGTVVVYEWPVYPGQVEAFEDCADRHRADSRWIAFMDVDEFLFAPDGRRLPDVLRAFEPWPGILVSRPTYGSSGHETRPSNLAIESYALRANSARRTRVGKSIACPRYVDRCVGAHYWTYTEGYAVDEKRRPAPSSRPLSPSFSVLRMNHYMTRSRQEFERKHAIPRADSGTLRETVTFEVVDQALNDVSDLAAAAYAPAVREALSRRRGLAPVEGN